MKLRINVIELGLFLFVLILTLSAIFESVSASAQGRFFSTPSRGGSEGAKGQAMLHTLLQENMERRNETAANAASITILREATEASLTTIGDCGTLGTIFGPGHALADGNDCIPSLQIAPDGRVSLKGGMKFGAYALCDPTTAGTIRYNASANRMEFCNGDVWGMMGGNAGCSINFPAITNADPDTFYDSTDAIYSGTTATASVAGATAAAIRRNGNNTGMSSGVTINQGNSIGIRGRSAPLFNQTATFTLDVGSYTACWQLTTKQQDVSPNAFSFTSLNNQELNALVTSNSVSVSGFDGPLTITISGDGGAELKVGSGGWNTSASVEPGQSIQLRMMTANAFETAHAASVLIGTYVTSWTVTTRQDMLYGGAHSPNDCQLAFGVVDNTTGVNACRFNRGGAGTACPTGWTQYQNWSETASINSGGAICGPSNVGRPTNAPTCNTGSHAWGNIPRETCVYEYCTCHGCGCCNNRTAGANFMYTLCY